MPPVFVRGLFGLPITRVFTTKSVPSTVTKVATSITKTKSTISRLVNWPLEDLPGLVISSPSAISDGVCHALRTLLAFIPPFRALTVSKVSRSPILMPSGSIPEALRSLMCKNVSGPPSSPLMNPKPRSAFHVFNVPAGILFPLFQPEASAMGTPRQGRRPVPTSAGARHLDAVRPGHVPDAGRVRRVRALDDPGTGHGRSEPGQGGWHSA